MELKVTEADLRDLLGKLFSGYRSVQLLPLRAGRSGAGVVKARPVQIRAGRTLVIKYGSHGDIADEYDRYLKYVRDYIEDDSGRTTSVEDVPCYTWLVGGLKYHLVYAPMGRVREFDLFYNQADSHDIVAAVEQLFTNTCRRWYSSTTAKWGRITESYFDPDEQTKLADLFPHLYPEFSNSLCFRVNGVDIDFPNPANHLRSFSPPSQEYTICVVHGDLNPGNVFVEHTSKEIHTWLIDFARTGPNHRLTDLVKLEICVIFELLDEHGIKDFFDFAKMLVTQESLDSELKLPSSISVNASYEKAAEVIAGIRHVAKNVQNGVSDIEEYRVALLCRAWKAIRYVGKSIPAEKRLNLALFLSMLSEVLPANKKKT